MMIQTTVKLSDYLMPLIIIILIIAAFILYPVITIISVSFLLLLYLIKLNPKTSIAALFFYIVLLQNIYLYLTDLTMTRFMLMAFYSIPFIVFIIQALLGRKYTYYLDSYIFFIIVFYIMLMASALFISSYTSYGLEKLMYFTISIYGCFILHGVITKSSEIKLIIKGYQIFSIILLLFSLVTFYDERLNLGKYFMGRFSTLGINPIWISRYFSYGIIVNIYFILKNKRNFLLSLLYILLSGFYLYFMFLSGSRGPLLGMILAVIVFSVLYFRLNIKKILITILIIYLAFTIVHSFVKEGTDRISGNRNSASSDNARIIAQVNAYELFTRNIVTGSGFGAYNEFRLKYPHNLFSEIISETGLIGLFLLLIILGISLWRIIKLDKSRLDHCVVIAWLLAAFVNANLSGHIGYNTIFWLCLYLVNYIYWLQENQKIKQIEVT